MKVDDVPTGYPFDYEKRIIEEYVCGKGSLSDERVDQGCPRNWPRVPRRECIEGNPVSEAQLGVYRDWNSQTGERKPDPEVLAAALTEYGVDEMARLGLVFPEAGPRREVHYPAAGRDHALKVGILVSGGIAPGINAVIHGIVTRQELYRSAPDDRRSLAIMGYYDGFRALLSPGIRAHQLDKREVARQANLGGSMLGTSRAEEFLHEDPASRGRELGRAVDRLVDDEIDVLYVIGGDGSMRGAHALSKTAERMGKLISIVGIPKTMDNDILWVWQSFGFMSAVQEATKFIEHLHIEAKSNRRLCVIQLFGSDSGFVVAHAVLASGHCDLFLIPELSFTMSGICEYVDNVLNDRRGESPERPYGVVVMAETAIPEDADEYLMTDQARRVGGTIDFTAKEREAISAYMRKHQAVGETRDHLRSGTLKLISQGLQNHIRRAGRGDIWRAFRVFANEPRHSIRAIEPSCSDIIFAERLGSLAVDCAMAGYHDFMISQWLTEYVMVPLQLVTLGRKQIPRDGIFLKSVIARTDQPEDLT